jgi:hypothetical protein
MNARSVLFSKAIFLAVAFWLVVPVAAHAETDPSVVAAEVKANRAKLADEEKAAADAKAGKEAAQKAYDAAAAALAANPNNDAQRKLDDAEYALKMADYKLGSSTKAVERAQKKLDESLASAPKPAIEKPAVDIAAQKAAEAKAAEAKAAEAKAAEAKAAEAKAAEAKAAEAKAAEARRKMMAAAEPGCLALPAAPTKPSSEVNATEQSYAQGFLKQVNLLVAKKAADDVPPISPFPVLEGTKLNPCEVGQREALHFAYLGNGQYRLETPVLAGEQTFSVPNITTLERNIPDTDNGETYVFFLDGRDGRTKLSAYKKSLIDTPAQ